MSGPVGAPDEIAAIRTDIRDRGWYAASGPAGVLPRLLDEVAASRVKLAAIRAEVEPWADRILRDRILAILDGPTGG